MTEQAAESDAAEVTFTVSDKWPTPNNCRRVADALDAITPARYGDILRAYADAEDARFAGMVGRQVPRGVPTMSRAEILTAIGLGLRLKPEASDELGRWFDEAWDRGFGGLTKPEKRDE